MRFKLLACEVLARELFHAAAGSAHTVDILMLPKALHDLGGVSMRKRLQEEIDAISADEFDAVILGYALCGNGLAGLTARKIPLVAARAHDCIALLMGDRRAYQAYFDSNPGTYYRSTGWLERGQGLSPAVLARTGSGMSLEDLTAKYGEENGRYLYEEFNRYQQNYHRLTFIETGIEPGPGFEEQARQEAIKKGWAFEKVCGSLNLFERLVAGGWTDDDFLVVPPGHRIVVRYDDSVIGLERA